MPSNAPSKSLHRRLKNIGNMGTRIFGGRMGTLTNATTKTYQITCALAQDFDAIRVIMAHTDNTHSPFFAVVKAAVTSALGVDAGAETGTNNSAGTSWVSVTKSQSPAFALEMAPVARATTCRIAYTVSDWIPLSSIARTDGGTLPLLIVRAYCGDAAETALTVYGNGTDDFTNWASRSDDRVWISRSQTGDNVTTPSNFTSTTNTSQNVIVGVQYMARGQVVTVMGVGDSITEGRGTYLNEGFIMPACYAASNSSGGIAVEYANCGWAGEVAGTVQGFYQRALDILESEICPDILVLPNASPNDITTTISDAQITTFRTGFSQVLEACQRHNVLPVAWTWMPSNTSVKTYAATDSKRIAYNTSCLSGAYGAIPFIDLSTLISGAADGTSQVQMNAAYTSDGIHPNNAGNAACQALIQSALSYAIGD